jgi:hypothetical protein
MGVICRWVAASCSVPIFVVVFMGSAKADNPTKIGPNQWRIDRPEVRNRLTEYREITFQAGDRVEIEAGGCVQTGGSGKTWKRYVDPQGPNSDRLYHGLIWIPGATMGLTRIEGLPGRVLRVKSECSLPSGNYLRLGYEDDDYPDNGYLRREGDNGTGNQCLGLKDAYVLIKITHREDKQKERPEEDEDLDLVWYRCDPNGIPMNPRWGWQTRHKRDELPDPRSLCGGFRYIDRFKPSLGVLFAAPGEPPRVSQVPSIDVPSGSNNLICSKGNPFPGVLHGHANWGPATYDGYIYWEGHASFPTGDDDYNIRLYRDDQAGLTPQNNGMLLLEFDSDETIDYFDTPWWNTFHGAVDSSDADASQLVNRKYAIASGLFGLDVEHDAYSESHPVWALAIQTKVEAQDEHWAMFIRNWGDEGFCSQDQHYVDLWRNIYTFRLPWREGATSCSVKSQTFIANSLNARGPYIRIMNDRTRPNAGSVLLTFFLDQPEACSRIHGEIVLEWKGNPVEGQPKVKPVSRRSLVADQIPKEAARKKDEDDAERRLSELIKRMDPGQRKVFFDQFPKRNIVKDNIVLQKPVLNEADSELVNILNLPELLPTPPVRHAPDPLKAKKDYHRGQALKKALGENIEKHINK